jgi:hypothetical protein
VSTLSKIFVIINLVLAVAFATFALTLYSKRVHYYHKQRVAEVQKEQLKAKLEADIKTLEGKLAEETKAKENAIAKREFYKSEFEKLEKEKSDALVAKEAADSRVKVAVESQQLLAKQVKIMREELENTRKVVVALKERETVLRANEAELMKERNALKGTVTRARQDLAELHRDRKRMAEELANAEYVIATLIKKGYDVFRIVGPGAITAVPDVRTKVVDVRPATGHVALGAGKDSGIKEGFVFLIHRGDQYIGKVRVTTVWNTFSGGTIVERKKPIKAGDDAMTDTAPSP